MTNRGATGNPDMPEQIRIAKEATRAMIYQSTPPEVRRGRDYQPQTILPQVMLPLRSNGGSGGDSDLAAAVTSLICTDTCTGTTIFNQYKLKYAGR
jgi:hypothetical protein